MSPHKTNKNMETSFKQTTSNKVERYRLFLPQFELLISDEKEEISVLANTAAALREAFGFFWVGFYLVKDGQLILGPFQGSTACYRIHKGKGSMWNLMVRSSNLDSAQCRTIPPDI